MRIGLNTPVVVQLPGVASAWEADAGIAELAQVAQVADALGYDHLTCSEHVAVPSEAARRMLTGDPAAHTLLTAGLAGQRLSGGT